MHILHYFMNSYSVSQFLDESSNIRAGCKKDAIHDVFDTIHMSCIHNSRCNFLCNFFHPRSVMVAIVCSLPPEPAVLCMRALRERRWVRPQLRAHSVGGTWVNPWSHIRNLALLVCGDITLSFLSCPKYIYKPYSIACICSTFKTAPYS